MQKHYPHYLIEFARQLRQRSTPAEKILWEYLRDRRLANLKFVRQHPIGRYIADFYCHERRLIIELEGSVHETPQQRTYDSIRFGELSGQYRITRIRNEELLKDIESVLEKILARAALTP